MKRKNFPATSHSPGMRHKPYLLLLGLLFLFLGFDAHAQTIRVSGTVRDNNGAPLEGVNVRVKGLNSTGNVTDKNGEYAISVPASNTILIFSYTGFADKEENVKG